MSGYDPDLQPAPASWGYRRLGCGCLALLLVLAVLAVGAFTVPNPWALHIGGRSTLTERWQGYGAVRASNGGRYVLYLNLRGGLLNSGDDGGECPANDCASLGGTALLCTESGKTYPFKVTGAVHTWWSTDGAATSVFLGPDSPALYQDLEIYLRGAWHGPVLELSDPGGLAEYFTPRGVPRPDLSTANVGTATTAISYGSVSDFDRACRSLG